MSQLPRIVEIVGASHPVFRREVRILVSEWGPDSPPITVSMSAFGKATVRNADTLGRGEVQKILDLVERILTNGTEEEKNAAATGFLEATASATYLNEDDRWILTLMGPKAKEYLVAWDGFCGIGED